VYELMLGSVSSQVAMHSTSPVIVVRGRLDPPPEYYPGQIVVGADGSPAADRALAMAFEEAQLRGLPLTAVCAWSKPEKDAVRAPYVDQDGLRTLAEKRFHEAVDRWHESYPGVKAVAEMTDAPVIEALQAAAASARLLMLGSRGVGAKDEKSRYKFPYGDFENVHRCGVIAAEVRAAQRKYTDIEVAAAHLHGMLDEFM
jgi:nucleotide-binding universal stress UspA family protein